MINKQEGIILLNTLLMIGLVALIVVSQMQLIFLQFKAQNQFLLAHDAFQKLEALANQLAAGKQGFTKECIINELGPNEVIKRLKAKKGCHIAKKKENYIFLVEDLGVFPCLETRVHSHIYSTRHWRLTVVTTNKPFKILQYRIAKAARYKTCENASAIIIRRGLLSWRYLS